MKQQSYQIVKKQTMQVLNTKQERKFSNKFHKKY